MREGDLTALKGVGKRLRTEHLDAQIAQSLLPYCRSAVIVSKRGHTIVERNRLKRRLRELIRLYVVPHCSGIDLVLRTLTNAYGAEFSELSDEVKQIQSELRTVWTP